MSRRIKAADFAQRRSSIAGIAFAAGDDEFRIEETFAMTPRASS